MTSHNFTQQLVFLRWANNKLEDPIIEAEIRDRIKGAGVKIRKHLEDVPTPPANKQEVWEMLWVYMEEQGIGSTNLKRAVEDYEPFIETFADYRTLKEDLNEHLASIGLPDLEY